MLVLIALDKPSEEEITSLQAGIFQTLGSAIVERRSNGAVLIASKPNLTTAQLSTVGKLLREFGDRGTLYLNGRETKL